MRLPKILESQKSNTLNYFYYYSYYNLMVLYKLHRRNSSKGCLRYLLTQRPYTYEDDLNACNWQNINTTCIVTLKPKLFNLYKLFI